MIGVRVLYRGREETAHEGPRLIPMMLLAEVRETELRRKRKQGRKVLMVQPYFLRETLLSCPKPLTGSVSFDVSECS